MGDFIMNNINDMTPVELHIACAKWVEQNILGSEESDNLVPFLPDYEHDRNATMELVNAVPEDRHENYIEKLMEICGLDDLMLFDSALESVRTANVPDGIWKLLTADPIAIMRAFLTVMEDK
jgi:hypothetical protein